MKVVFLGTNGWYDTETGNTISVLLQTAACDIIFDAGNGIAKMDRYRPPGDGRGCFLFLSHFHLDHIAGLHTIVKIPCGGGLTICGPEGTRGILGVILAQPFTIPAADLPYAVKILELPRETAALPFVAEARPLRHASLTLGYRVEVEGRVVAYCPDTGYCENAVLLARGADLLIAECAYPSGMGDESWPHLNPEEAARIAAEGDVKALALVHFDAHQYPTLEDRLRAEAAARRIFPGTVAARDGMEIPIT